MLNYVNFINTAIEKKTLIKRKSDKRLFVYYGNIAGTNPRLIVQSKKGGVVSYIYSDEVHLYESVEGLNIPPMDIHVASEKISSIGRIFIKSREGSMTFEQQCLIDNISKEAVSKMMVMYASTRV